MFCSKCGAKLPDNSKFCIKCGASVAAVPSPEIHSTPMPFPVPSGKLVKYKCPGCSHVSDLSEGTACPKCKLPMDLPEGYFKLYRMGSPIGIAGGFGIYIDGQPHGYIGNKQTCWIKLPYGTHKLHVAVGMNRRCNDLEFTLSPDHNLECAKVRMVMGMWTNKFELICCENTDIPD